MWGHFNWNRWTHGLKLFVAFNRTLSLLFLCCSSTHCPGGPMSLDAPFPLGGGGIWVYGQMVCIYMNAWALSFIFSRTLYPGTKPRGEILFKLSLVLILWPITLSVNEEVTQFKRSHSIPFLGLVFLLWTPVNQELYRPPENSICCNLFTAFHKNT